LPNFQQLHLRGVGEGPAIIPSPVAWVAAVEDKVCLIKRKIPMHYP